MAIFANRYLILPLLFAAAVGSYLIGVKVGFWMLIAAGALFELAFWYEWFVRRRP